MTQICGLSLFIGLVITIIDTAASAEIKQKVRQKREWIIPPRKLKENVNYMDLEYIAKIRSDEETRTTIRYFLTGPGADQNPVNLFTVGTENGLVRIHGVLDREKSPTYHLRGVAKFLNGSYAEKDVDLRIVVLDENDCPPVFNVQMRGGVPELSTTDTFVMTVTATDADEEGTLHSKISYSIVGQSHSMFYMNQESGGIYVKHNTLDRERQDTYTLTVKGTDMNGAPNGNIGTGTVVISILDVNDNVPTLDKDFYECRVEENTKNVEVLRIQAIDADLIYTDNWLAVFSIVSGNEAGYFSITTDIKTNEGILILTKELDYEELKEVNMQVAVSNKAEYHSSVVITQRKSYPIRVSVMNQAEGPCFKPAVKVISLSEDSTLLDIRKVVTNYAAIDSDTLLTATDVRYAKRYDIDNWLLIDEKTADIRLNKIPDYESKFLINGTYYAEIICITKDYPPKTATGTIAIQVEDFNDHCPILSSTSQTLCYGDHAVYVTAVDRDHYPNAAPFDFTVDMTELWNIKHFNDTTAIFRSHTTLWPGVYHLFVKVRDQQGNFCAHQALQIHICTCDADKVCLQTERHLKFGATGVLLMLLGPLLLLLVPLLLLFCVCSGFGPVADFKAIPFDVKEHLMIYNTEGQGDDKEMALLQISKEVDEHNRCNVEALSGAQMAGDVVDGTAGVVDWSSFQQNTIHGNGYYHHTRQFEEELTYTQRKDEQMLTGFKGHNIYEGLALSDAFLARYYSHKSRGADKNHDVADNMRVYDYEGQESSMGSFEDICSLIHEEDNLSFLDNLDMKFRTLAEISIGSKLQTDINVTTPVTHKLTPSIPHVDASMLETGKHSEETENTTSTTIVQTTDAEQASRCTGTCIHEKMLRNPALLVQQPALFYTTSNPVYMMDSHPTLLVTASPVVGIQDNLLMVEEKGVDPAQGGISQCEMQKYQSVVVIENQPTKESVQTQGCVSGMVEVVESTMLKSTDACGAGQVLHPSNSVVLAGMSATEVCCSLDKVVSHRL